MQGFNSIFVQATKYPAAPVHQHTQIFEEQIQGSGRCHGHVELIATASVAKHGMISALSIKLDFRDQMAVSKLNGIEICTACISCHSFLTIFCKQDLQFFKLCEVTHEFRLWRLQRHNNPDLQNRMKSTEVKFSLHF